MNLTQQQQAAVNHIKNNTGLTLISAIAGSGKTSTLTAIAESIPHNNGLYLAYNKSIATSSTSKFPKGTVCLTTHSLAYRAVVTPNKLKVGIFNYRSIKEKISYTQKCEIVDLIREFCLSKYTDYHEFCKDNKLKKQEPLIGKYLNLMQQGKIEVTHEFYLKLFHIYLAEGLLEYEPFDFIMLDEAGDLNEVTLEIFKLLPSDRKIAVGDPHQNIYSFNHTINCFEVLKDEGTLFPLSETFRVSSKIAKRVSLFCKTYLDPDMEFYSTQPSSGEIKTRAYITRTNSALIERMIQLNQTNTPYSLVRKATEIFKLPLMVANLKYQSFVPNPEYAHIQQDYDQWHEIPELQLDYKTPLSYIGALYSDDIQLSQAIRTLSKYGKNKIFDTYYEAKKHENTHQNYTLTTAHSAKGLEFDEVEISPDLNDSIAPIVTLKKLSDVPLILSREDIESLNLYYVAVTRCTKSLINAAHL